MNGRATEFYPEKSALEQHPDILRIKGLLKGYKSEPCYDCYAADYIAEWTVMNNNLYLTGIYPANAERPAEKADLNAIFHVRNARVKANWVNAEFWIPVGKTSRWHEALPIYRAEKLLEIKHGQIVKLQDYNYPNDQQLSLIEVQEFIYKGIRWDKIPNMGDAQKKLIIYFECGATGKPENAHLRGATDCKSCNEETLRALSLLPWPPDYSNTKPLPSASTVFIIFNEEQRKIYSH